MQKNEKALWSDRKHILWFPISFTKYRIANGRIYCTHGLLRQEEHECLIYRVLDISLVRTLGNRICGTGTIVLRTRDASDPVLELKNIKNSRDTKDMISSLVEIEKKNKNVIGRDMYGSSADGEQNHVYDELTE